ncbi:MAG: tetratricopeptide repeat protein, partial [Verrucomicrobia bacterium]|nr:tetratricopeptide repeat protein [Verrucomicrobiota bacterium]
IETPSEPQVKEIKTTESKPENKKIISIIPKETNNKGENSDKKGNIFTRMFSKKENSTTTEPDSNTEKNKQTNKPKEKVSNAGVQPVPPTISVIPDENEEDTELTETPKEPIHVYNTYKYKNPPKPASGDRQAGQADFQRAYRAHQNKDMATAAEYYLKAIQKDPNWYDAHFNLGLAYYSAGEYSSALLAFENALAVNPDSWEARYNFALALNKANYPNEAILELLKSARLNDKYANTWLELGMIYDTRFSDIENAYQCYQKFIEVAPEHPSAYAAKVWMARHADQVKQK